MFHWLAHLLWINGGIVGHEEINGEYVIGFRCVGCGKWYH